MVTSVTNFGRNGLSDWLIQRVSAVVMLIYTVFLVVYLLNHPHLDYATWQGLFAHPLMKIATLIVLLLLLAHMWIGLWIVFTDYIKCPCGRLFLQTVVILLILGYLLWGILMIWG